MVWAPAKSLLQHKSHIRPRLSGDRDVHHDKTRHRPELVALQSLVPEAREGKGRSKFDLEYEMFQAFTVINNGKPQMLNRVFFRDHLQPNKQQPASQKTIKGGGRSLELAQRNDVNVDSDNNGGMWVEQFWITRYYCQVFIQWQDLTLISRVHLDLQVLHTVVHQVPPVCPLRMNRWQVDHLITSIKGIFRESKRQRMMVLYMSGNMILSGVF